MAQEFKIGRLRYTWRGIWATEIFYNRDAVVQYQGKTYYCLEPHTAQADFYDDLTYVTPQGASTPRWELMIDGRIWKNAWTPLTFYSVGNIVTYGGVVYVCTVSHTSGASEISLANWATYASFDSWNSAWTPNTVYGENDIVKYGGVVYRCVIGHTSAATDELGLEADYDENDSSASKWEWVNAGVEYKGEWNEGTRYKRNDVVRAGSDLYIATEGHTGVIPFDYLRGDSTFSDSTISKWQLWQPGTSFKTTWEENTVYQIGDIVIYGGYSYRSVIANNTGYIPSESLQDDSTTTWEIVTEGYQLEGEWSSGNAYQTGDVVTRGGSAFVALSNSEDEDPVDFGIQTQYTAAGSSGTTLKVASTTGIVPGMVVTGLGFTDGQTVVRVTDSTTLILSREPNHPAVLLDGGTLDFVGVNYAYWQLINIGKYWTGFWQDETRYLPGQTVIFSNGTYVCIQVHDSGLISRPDLDVTRTFWVAEAYSDRNNAGQFQGDIVTRSAVANIALPITGEGQAQGEAGENAGQDTTPIDQTDFHLGVESNRPKWKDIQKVADVYYVSPEGTDAAGYGSSQDKPFRSIKYACEHVARGTNFQIANQIFVANKEWLVAEMAAWMEYQRQNNIAPYTPVSVWDDYSTTRDARLVLDAISYDLVRGGNTRTVRAALAYFASTSRTSFRNTATDAAQDYIYTSLAFLKSLFDVVFQNTKPEAAGEEVNYQLTNLTWDATKTYALDDYVFYQSDPEDPDTAKWYQSTLDGANINYIPPESFNWTEVANPGLIVLQDIDNGLITEPFVEDAAKELIDIVINSVQFADKSLIPQAVGSETATINVKTGTYPESLPIIVPENVAINGDELRGATVIPKLAAYTYAYQSEANTNQITLASVEDVEVGQPIQFSAPVANDKIGGDNLISGQTYYVIEVDGNKIKIAATVDGAEIVLDTDTGNMIVYSGDNLKDMFYVRNASGIRNITVRGLAGSLTAPNSFATQRPTGGAYVSLDPGTGPNDTLGWITYRSPYIQNVTTFGNGCTGLKIDGYLHNGGNKSIVCNDFTQVISDGIGVWCTGPASLTECVSVFAYYCYAGYFAEDGGRIRATNGNSSYGTFGVIAEGFDPTETPIAGLVDNQSSQVQASVQSAFGAAAQLLSLGYDNAGSNYFEQATNMLKYSNQFDESVWQNDGNVILQQNLASPFGETNAWTVTAQTSSTDSSYFWQDTVIPQAGAVYTNVEVLNVTGSGNSATFDITVGATGYSAVVNSGGTGYVVGNTVRVLGSVLGGLDGVNDCFLEVSSLAGSAILGVTVTGTVPDQSDRRHSFSIYAKKGTASAVTLETEYSGSATVSSSITYDFDAGTTSTSSTGGGVTPTYDILSLTNGWYRLTITTYDSTALNTQLRAKVYPRAKNGFAGYTRFFGAQLDTGAEAKFFQYTQNDMHSANADFFVRGAGTGAKIVGNETRSASVFQARLTDPGTGTGGRGHLIASNNAQGGDDTQIIIAGSDENEATNYNSMRVFLQSGTGAGQYGYIATYDSSLKTAIVLKESFESITVTQTEATTDEFSTTDSVYNLYPNQQVRFIPTYYSNNIIRTSTDTFIISETIGGSTNTFICDSTAKLAVNMPIQFSGAVFGGVIESFTYYVKEIVDNTTFTISTEPFGTAILLNSATGAMNIVFPGFNSYLNGSTQNMLINMPISFTGNAIGGVTVGQTYYVNDVIDENNFTISSNLISVPVTATAAVTNELTTTSTGTMVPLNPISFSGTMFGGLIANTKYYINRIVNGTTFTLTNNLTEVDVTQTQTTTNLITCSSTSGFTPNDPIIFRGAVFGNLANESVYYILAVNDGTTFTVSLSPGGAAVNLIDEIGEIKAYTSSGASVLTTDTGNITGTTTNTKTTLTFGIGSMNSIFSTTLFGNVSATTDYYIKDITPGTPSNKFTVSATPGGAAVSIQDDLGSMNVGAVGWDHINPGTSIAPTLDNSTVYYIEPRITYNDPDFGQTSSVVTTIAPGTEWTAIGYGENTWLAIPSGNAVASKSTDGETWTSVSLPKTATWTDVAYGANYWVIISNDDSPAQTGSSVLVSPNNGGGFRAYELPSKTAWSNVAYGNGKFVAIATGTAQSAYSTSYGQTWSSGVGLPSANWQGLAYGGGRFIAVSNGVTYNIVASQNVSVTNPAAGGATFNVTVAGTAYEVELNAGGANYTINDVIEIPGSSLGGASPANDIEITVNGVDPITNAITGYTVTPGATPAAQSNTAAYSTDGINWTTSTLPLHSSWKDIAFGAGLFVAISDSGEVSAYTRDGITWETGQIALTTVDRIEYGQGVFLAVSSQNGTAYTSENGADWHERTVTNDQYGAVAFGYTSGTYDGRFVTVAQQTVGSYIEAGCRTKARATVTSGRITDLNLWEPGSGYTATTPTITITDPNISLPAVVDNRVSNGVLGNPTFINRGSGYNTNSTTITINGSGFADTFQTGLTLIVKNLSQLPGPGDNLTINGSSVVYKVTSANVVFGTVAPNIKANIQVSPDVTVANSPLHETAVEIRTKYSQARLTGHDFLNIGYGTETESNYPGVPEDTVLSPQDQAVEVNFGRVFYVSTDQDGNFKVGDLFGVEQATGIVTLSASQFGLEGLDTLSLGGISVGGSSVVVRQFSTDPTFIANSNEIIPTQRAIKAYLTGRLSQGGANTFTGQLIAGTVLVGGNDRIASTIPNGSVGSVVNMPVLVTVEGQYGGWDGDGAAMAYFMKSFNKE